MGVFICTGYILCSEIVGSYGNCTVKGFNKLHTREGDGQEVQKGGDICVHMADSC